MGELAKVVPPLVVTGIGDLMSLGETFARSGFFQDGRTAAQCVVKMIAGSELGFGPMASMTGIHIIEGKPTVGAHLLAALVKRSDRYDYDVIVANSSECRLEFWERSLGKDGETRKGSAGWAKKPEPILVTLRDFTENGTAVGKDGKLKANWKRSPDDMLFARAISKGYRRYCPDLSCGVSVYTPDEIEVEPVPVLAPAIDASYTVNGNAVDQNAPAGPPPEKVQPAQLERIDVLAGQLRWPAERFAAQLQKEYGKDRPEELTPQQADNLEGRLEAAFRKTTGATP